MEWRVMVRVNAVVRVMYVQLANGDWMKSEMKENRRGAEQGRHIFEARITPHLHAAGIRPFLFWIQRIPDSSVYPERPPMFDAVGRKPLHPAQRQLYGYDQTPRNKEFWGE